MLDKTELIQKCSSIDATIIVGLKCLLKRGLSESVTVVTIWKTVGWKDFSDQFSKIIIRYNRTGYNINVMHRLHAWWLTQSRFKCLLKRGLSESVTVVTI